MIEAWVLWLFLVGIVAGAVVTWLVMVRLPRGEHDVGAAERPAEAAWISQVIERHGGVAPSSLVEEVLDLHQVYLRDPRLARLPASSPAHDPAPSPTSPDGRPGVPPAPWGGSQVPGGYPPPGIPAPLPSGPPPGSAIPGPLPGASAPGIHPPPGAPAPGPGGPPPPSSAGRPLSQDPAGPPPHAPR